MTEATILALVAIVGSVITALFKLLSDNTKALTALVAETRKGNDEARDRNGHLGEQNENITRMIITHAEDSRKMVDEAVSSVEKIMEPVVNIKHQNIEPQHVDKIVKK